MIDAVRERERLRERHVHGADAERAVANGLAQLEPRAQAVLALLERWHEHEVRTQRSVRVGRRCELLLVALVERRHLEARLVLMPHEPDRQELGRAEPVCGEVLGRPRRGRGEDREVLLRRKTGRGDQAPRGQRRDRQPERRPCPDPDPASAAGRNPGPRRRRRLLRAAPRAVPEPGSDQRLAHARARVEAAPAVALEHALDDARERRAHGRVQLGGRARSTRSSDSAAKGCRAVSIS